MGGLVLLQRSEAVPEILELFAKLGDSTLMKKMLRKSTEVSLASQRRGQVLYALERLLLLGRDELLLGHRFKIVDRPRQGCYRGSDLACEMRQKMIWSARIGRASV